MAPEDVKVIQGLADVATIGLLQERNLRRTELLTGQLQHALNSRVAIEQAKGVIAQTYSCSVDEAFELLRTYCRNHHLRVGEVACEIITDPASMPPLR